MRTTLTAIQGKGKLNNASSATAGGTQDPTTGIAISTGVNSGDFIELTDAQALALSDTTIGTLYGGVFQRVKFHDATSIAVGQAVYWDLADTTDPYSVTIVSSATQFNFAGTVIDNTTTAGQYAWIQVNGRVSALMTGAGAIGDFVAHPTSSTNEFVASTGTAPVAPITVGVQLTAASGAGALAQVLITRAQTRF